MKHLFVMFTVYWAALPLMAGESGLVKTFQPLDGYGADGISIEEVVCYASNLDSGSPYRILLISAPYKPPTISGESKPEINLASICGISFWTHEEEQPPRLHLEATQFADHGFPPEEVIRACLECLRRVLPEKLMKAPLVFDASEKDRKWIGKLVAEFNAHDRTKEFFKTGVR